MSHSGLVCLHSGCVVGVVGWAVIVVVGEGDSVVAGQLSFGQNMPDLLLPHTLIE